MSAHLPLTGRGMQNSSLTVGVCLWNTMKMFVVKQTATNSYCCYDVLGHKSLGRTVSQDFNVHKTLELAAYIHLYNPYRPLKGNYRRTRGTCNPSTSGKTKSRLSALVPPSGGMRPLNNVS